MQKNMCTFYIMLELHNNMLTALKIFMTGNPNFALRKGVKPQGKKEFKQGSITKLGASKNCANYWK